LISTEAPAFTNLSFISSASSFVIPSLIGLGTDSTNSFASLRPSDVIALTSLITGIFLSPKPVKTTSKVVFSSAA